jgi:hypothetical protein
MKNDLLFSSPPLGAVLSYTGLPGGGTTIYDRSLYGNHGAISGATWYNTATGVPYLYFDGVDDYVNIGSGESLDITTAISLEAWVYFDSAGIVRDIFRRTSSYILQINNVERARLVVYKGAGAGVNVDLFHSDTMVVDTWYYIVGTFDGSTAYLYLNAGTPDSQAQSITIASNPATDVGLGSDGAGGGNDHKGGIAFPKMYHRTLGADEIRRRFDAKKRLFEVW